MSAPAPGDNSWIELAWTRPAAAVAERLIQVSDNIVKQCSDIDVGHVALVQSLIQ